MDLKNKKILVIGLGKSGFAAAKLAKSKGAFVFVTENSTDKIIEQRAGYLEKENIEVEINGHTRRFLKHELDLAVISPGINVETPFIKEGIVSKGVPVIGEIELAFRFCRCDKIIAVTGTNGKSTTVELLGHVLKSAGRKVVVCGNIGEPFADYIDKIDAETFVALEISSYQLETIKDFKPRVSIILNITEDHLSRYNSMREYTLAKMRIFENQTKNEVCIANLDDKSVKDFLPHIKASTMFFSRLNKKADCFVENNKITLNKNGQPFSVCSLSDLPFSGNHNIENTLACALAVSFFFKDIGFLKKAIPAFKPLEHRTQFVDTIRGIDFINDSKATNVGAAEMAVEALDKDIILICGGRNKKNNFSGIIPAAKNKIKLAIAIGEAKEEIYQAFKGFIKTEFAADLDEAVRMAFKKADKGECVLLSPMCASFDMFRNFEERGYCFMKIVSDIKKEVITADVEL